MIPRKRIHYLITFFVLTVDTGICYESKPNEDKAVVATQIFPIVHSKPSPGVKSYSADQMCREYSQLIYRFVKNPILNTTVQVKDCVDTKILIIGGTRARPKEFPHMAMLGVDESPPRWVYGGSLISNRWILSVAPYAYVPRWARLGELNLNSSTDDARPEDYRISEIIIHPNFKKPSFYNNIALYRLEKDVVFSSYIRPICLNTDKLLKPSVATAIGWGITEIGGTLSEDLLKVNLDIIPMNKCNDSYSPVNKHLDHGIDDDSMVCAGSENGGKDTCYGDSGSPLQIVNSDYDCMHTQIGISAFGKSCGLMDSPGVYTRVSEYISWIEPIVWPKVE